MRIGESQKGHFVNAKQQQQQQLTNKRKAMDVSSLLRKWVRETHNDVYLCSVFYHFWPAAMDSFICSLPSLKKKRMGGTLTGAFLFFSVISSFLQLGI